MLVLPDGRIYVCTTNRDFAGTPNADDDKIIELKNDNFLNVESFENSSIALFPNPSNGHFFLKIDEEIGLNSTLEILSINGASIMKQPIKNQLTPIKTDMLNSGVYILKVNYFNASVYRKIIVK